MNKKNALVIAILLCSVVIAFTLLSSTVSADPPKTPANHILDQAVDLKLTPVTGSCFEQEGELEKPLDEMYGNLLPYEIKKQWKTKRVKYATETWSSTERIIIIERWYFANHNDALLYPYMPNHEISGAIPFHGWSQPPDPPWLGNASCWINNTILVFTKENVLVKINVQSSLRERAYTELIAKNILKKI